MHLAKKKRFATIFIFLRGEMLLVEDKIKEWPHFFSCSQVSWDVYKTKPADTSRASIVPHRHLCKSPRRRLSHIEAASIYFPVSS